MAHRSSPDSIPIPWEMKVVIVSPDALESLNCIRCQTPLDLHQPDEKNPGRLLGTCGHCAAWFQIAIGSRGAKVHMFRLPDVEDIRAGLSEARKNGRIVAQRNPPALLKGEPNDHAP